MRKTFKPECIELEQRTVPTVDLWAPYDAMLAAAQASMAVSAASLQADITHFNEVLVPQFNANVANFNQQAAQFVPAPPPAQPIQPVTVTVTTRVTDAVFTAPLPAPTGLVPLGTLGTRSATRVR